MRSIPRFLLVRCDFGGAETALAALEAAQRADAMLERGDMDGAAVWRRVLAAVKELQRKERREGEAAH